MKVEAFTHEGQPQEIAPPKGKTRPALNFAGRPEDAVSPQFLGFSGVIGFLSAWLITRTIELSDATLIALLFLTCTSLPIIVLSLWVNKTHLRDTTGLSPHKQRGVNIVRVGTKLLGLAATLGTLAAAYWLFPEYARDFYRPVWEIVSWIAFPVGVLTVAYFFWTDQRMLTPHDAYWQLGSILLGQKSESRQVQLKQHALAWGVKGFFLPLMLTGTVEMLSSFSQNGFNFDNFAVLYTTVLTFVYSLDVTFGAIGYSLTLRALDSHVRSTEATPMGWFSALICYVPFSTFVWGSFLQYKGEFQWNQWLGDYPVLYISWGFAILVLLFIYVWATVSFGCRFSNLTHRGIIIDGPYRFIRHPAYVAKNLAWWLMYVPFAAHQEWQSALKGCICLFLTNVIYAVRAKTEERHLSADPAYREYCRMVEQNGLVAHLKELLFLRKGNHAG